MVLGDLGTIQRVSTLTSTCQDCGMTILGQVNVKICGGAPGWPCCSIVNMAGFKEGFFTEGQIDDFSGDDMLEDCYNYSLSQLSNPADLDITVYHEGSDGGALDWIEVSTNKATVRCTLGAFLDGFSNQKGYCA